MLVGLMLANSAVVLMGLAGVIAKFTDCNALTISFFRALIAALFFAFTSLFSSRLQSKITLKLKLKLLITGMILAIHWVSFFYAIEFSTVATAVLSFSTYPVFVNLWELKFHPQKSFSFESFALIGVLAIIFPLGDDPSFVEGFCAGLVSSISFAFYTLINKSFQEDNIAVPQSAMWQNFAVALCLVIFPIDFKAVAQQDNWSWLLILGFVNTGLMQVLYLKSLKFLSAGLVSIIGSLEAFYGILSAWLILGETPMFREVIGGLVMLAIVGFGFYRFFIQTQRQSEKIKV